MIKSMTAFANSELEIENLTLNCEIRSVNHRYCDISIRIPDALRFSEGAIHSLISSEIKRGKIECSLSYKKNALSEQTITINENAVKALLQTTDKIEEFMHMQQAFSAIDVLNFPGVQQQKELDKDILISGIKDLVDKSVAQIVSTREREGSQLANLIKQRINKITALIEDASERLPEVLEQIKVKLNKRISELVSDPDFDRLEQEMVFLTQKLDVAEELDRLKTHTQEVLRILENKEPVGRRLDFLMQELNREANTLGSKSADQQMTQISIDLKVLIEQMREQIQNIE